MIVAGFLILILILILIALIFGGKIAENNRRYNVGRNVNSAINQLDKDVADFRSKYGP